MGSALFNFPMRFVGSPRLERYWLHCWAVTGGMMLAGVLAQYPIVGRVIRTSLNRLVAPDQVEQAWNGIQTWMVVGIMASPLVVLVKACVYAGVLHLAVAAFGRSVRFRRLLALVLAASTLYILEFWFVLALLYGRGWRHGAELGDLNITIGLDLLVAADSPWAALLGQANLFQAGFMLVMFAGLTVGNLLSRSQAAAAVGGVWLGAALLADRVQAWGRLYADLLS